MQEGGHDPSTQRRPQNDEKTGTWSFVIGLPTGPEGPAAPGAPASFATKREAQEAFDGLKVAARDGAVVEPSKLTVGTFLLGTPEPAPAPGWIDSSWSPAGPQPRWSPPTGG